jgi:pimeloyl-ACP methyl ester carboxylesterase
MTIAVTSSGSGEPVLLLHSSGLSSRQWRRLAEQLVVDGVRAVAPDFIGHGASAEHAGPWPFRFGYDVDAVAELARSLGAPFHVVGHSYGGFVGLKVAERLPALVRSVTVYDAVAWGALDRAGRDAGVLGEFDRIVATWPTLDDEAWLRAFVDWWGGGAGAWSKMKDDVKAEMRRTVRVVRGAVESLIVDDTPASAYAAVTAPFRFITGERTPRAAQLVLERLREAVGGPPVHVVAGAGHFGPVTHADAVVAVVRDAVRAARAAG